MRALFLAASALTLFSLAACGQQEASDDSPVAPAAPPRQAADESPPPARTVTQASATAPAEGAYGMPHAPVPYNQLGAYERQWDQQGRQDPSIAVQPGQPEPQAAPSQARMSSKPRSADTVFY